jgi:hypothetical protein
MAMEIGDPPQPDLETLYSISVLPKSVSSLRLFSPVGPYMLDMSLKLFSSEEYSKWMRVEDASRKKQAVWHIIDVALSSGIAETGYVPLPGLQDVWNQCGSLMGPRAHWVVPLGRGLLCDAQEGGRALKGIWRCVVDAVGNPSIEIV